MHLLAAKLIEIIVLGLGVSLLMLWIGYLKAERAAASSAQPDGKGIDREAA